MLGGAAIAWPITARGQQQAGKVRRIGVFAPGSVQTHGQYVTAFRNKLNTLGYAEGTNYVLLVRWGEGNFDRFADYARELVEAGPDVILVIGTAVATAVKGQTSTIPAIFVQVADPIGGGFVKSLSRPGSNFTGFANYEPGMVGKWSGSHVQSADNIRGRCTFLGSI